MDFDVAGCCLFNAVLATPQLACAGCALPAMAPLPRAARAASCCCACAQSPPARMISASASAAVNPSWRACCSRSVASLHHIPQQKRGALDSKHKFKSAVRRRPIPSVQAGMLACLETSTGCRPLLVAPSSTSSNARSASPLAASGPALSRSGARKSIACQFFVKQQQLQLLAGWQRTDCWQETNRLQVQPHLRRSGQPGGQNLPLQPLLRTSPACACNEGIREQMMRAVGWWRAVHLLGYDFPQYRLCPSG